MAVDFSKMKFENVKLFNYMSQTDIEKMAILIQKVTTVCPQIIAVRFSGATFKNHVPCLCFETTDNLSDVQSAPIYHFIENIDNKINFKTNSYISGSEQIIDDDGTIIWTK